MTYLVLINILPPVSPIEIGSRYQSDCYGLQARQDYRVINLWEVEVATVFERPIPSLLPFVPILKGGGEPWYRQILQEGEKIGEKRGEKRGKRRGLLSGIAMGLELKFGNEGLQLMPEIEVLEEVEVLETVLAALKVAESVDELRRVYGGNCG